jgi:D-alanyl-lipoteichoic acid acyltransferase DltB (MBOAT superfamily)
MIFNSLEFLAFFPLVAVVYFSVPLRLRIAVLLAAGCWFYMAWVPGYIVVLILSSFLAYAAGLAMGTAHGRARAGVLAGALVIVSGILIVFKYLGFLEATLAQVMRQFSITWTPGGINLLLPLGISFYTFKLLSYIIDVYRGALPPEKNIGAFFLYASFFPQVLAGPIERATRFLPQLQRHAAFDAGRIAAGLKLMLWGLFMKVVIADRLAILVNRVYDSPADQSSAALLVATYLYAFQIFCDFAGYSDMAIGAAKVLGFDTMENFRRPYFSKSIAEFWRRWHMSLSFWFRDYLYIPLGGNRLPPLKWGLAVMAVFLVSGLWHGAAWTFVAWGALHGTYLIVERATKPLRERAWAALSLSDAGGFIRKAAGVAVTFHLVTFAWIFFRAPTMSDAMTVIGAIVNFRP